MSCPEFERLIALWAEGDTTERESGRVRAHLESCAACRAFAKDLAASQAAFKALAGEAVDADVLREVRERVFAQVSAAPHAPWAWRWAWALPLALLLAAGIWISYQPNRRPAPVPPRPPAVAAVTPAEPPRLAPTRPPVHRAHRRARLRPKPQPQPPLLVKLETGDPQVVIYWIFETTGE